MLPHPSPIIRANDAPPASWCCPKCGAVVYGPRDHHAMLCPLYRAEKQDGIYKAQAKERMREGGGDHCSDEYKKRVSKSLQTRFPRATPMEVPHGKPE